MSPQKVLMFGWEFAPIVSGGLGVVCRSLTQSLSKQGLDITFVLPKLPSKFKVDFIEIVNASEKEIDESSLKLIEVDSLLHPYLSRHQFKELAERVKKRYDEMDDQEIYGSNLFDEVIRFAARASEIATTTPHDVIHAHDWMTFRAAITAKKISKKPLVVHIHATELERTAGYPNPLIFDYEKEGMLAADKVIAVSEKTKEKIVENYGIDENKVEVVHNAVDEAKKTKAAKPLIKNDGSRKVLFLARLAPSKGADYLLQAAAKVLTKMPDARFIFVGKGSMQEKLEEMVEELDISENVDFLGFVNNDKVDIVYKQADLFVMPSIAEPFGITALEAIRNGTPVLMSKQSGAGEIIRNALKVDFWDVEEMANKILAVLHHRPLAKTLSDNGYTDLNKLSWDNQSLKVIEIYRTLI